MAQDKAANRARTTESGGDRRIVARTVAWSTRRPWLVVALSLLAAVLAGLYAADNFAMDTETDELISPDLAWRRNNAAFDRAFPEQIDLIAVVIDGATPERAEAAARLLAERLAADTGRYVEVRRPDGGPWFDRQGLLLLPTERVRQATEQLIAAQPFLGPMAADPSLRGVLGTLDTALAGVSRGAARLEDLRRPLAALADALGAVADGRRAFFSWQALFGGGEGAPRRRFILVKPRLDFSALQPGAEASAAIRDAARALGLTPQEGVAVRLTGPIPLVDEEFASLADKAVLVTAAMLLAVLAMLWLAVRSLRITAAILIATLVGLVVTAGLGLLTVGRLNLISVAFIPLFVGLGVDFGIQFSVRYRSERLREPALDRALVRAGGVVGGSLVLAATAIAAGFFAFLPTDYVGVSELGLIAGVGMIAALLLNVTLLPALLMLLRPRRETAEVGLAVLAPLDEFLIRRRKEMLVGFAAVGLLCLASLPFVRFDFNPLHLRDPGVESMSTLADLRAEPNQTPNTINVLAPSLSAADALARRLSALPEVSAAVTLSSFVPDEQENKLALLGDAALLLDPTLNPAETAAPPTDAELVAALGRTAASLRAAAGEAGGPAADDARRLGEALERLAGSTPERRAEASETAVAPLRTLLDQTRAALRAEPVSLETLPPDLRRAWVDPADGTARIQVFPTGNSDSNAVLARFAEAVARVAPDAAGAAVSIKAAGETVVGAFVQAGVWSLLAITALLFAVLRRAYDVAVTLLPIILTGLLTLATCVAVDLPLNFANVIALPLLFGIGVAFHCYLVIAWRAGETHFLQSALARGVLFSALTTGIAFGALRLSSHPGTASMGELLLISLGWTLATALLFGPVLMGPSPAKDPP